MATVGVIIALSAMVVGVISAVTVEGATQAQALAALLVYVPLQPVASVRAAERLQTLVAPMWGLAV
jgi:hypothetical protein